MAHLPAGEKPARWNRLFRRGSFFVWLPFIRSHFLTDGLNRHQFAGGSRRQILDKRERFKHQITEAGLNYAWLDPPAFTEVLLQSVY